MEHFTDTLQSRTKNISSNFRKIDKNAHAQTLFSAQEQPIFGFLFQGAIKTAIYIFAHVISTFVTQTRAASAKLWFTHTHIHSLFKAQQQFQKYKKKSK